MSDNNCLCQYPCQTENCPKEKDVVCYINHCDVIDEYSRLTYKKNYCSVCGRKLD